MKTKHTNLWNEVYKGKKPDTSWHAPLIAMVSTIVVCLAILVITQLMQVV